MATFANASVFKLGSTTISEVTSISAPNLSADTIDVTTHGSTSRYREFIQGLRDGGEISIEGFYNTASSATIVTQFNTTSAATATIDLPTSPSVTRFTASVICTAFSAEAPVDGAIGYSATFKVTGVPTIGTI
jgi:predicted secreted protein